MKNKFKASVKARAKLNLTLEITGIKSDGYHLLESLMTPIDLYDVLDISLTILPENNAHCLLSIASDNTEMPIDHNNTIWKAWDSIKHLFNIGISAEVKVRKNIPSGAGMGGGSADAAAFIRLIRNVLSEKFQISVDDPRWLKTAIATGCDVPFCLLDSPAITRGIGENLELIKLPKPLWAVVAKSENSASTPVIYKEYDHQPLPYVDALSNFFDKNECYNALQPSAVKCCQEIDHTLIVMEKASKSISASAPFASPCMTGSGSACFLLTDNPEQASAISDNLKNRFPFVTYASLSN